MRDLLIHYHEWGPYGDIAEAWVGLAPGFMRKEDSHLCVLKIQFTFTEHQLYREE